MSIETVDLTYILSRENKFLSKDIYDTYQKTKSLLNEKSLEEFIKEKF